MVDAKLTDREIKGMVYSHTGSIPVLTTKYSYNKYLGWNARQDSGICR